MSKTWGYERDETTGTYRVIEFRVVGKAQRARVVVAGVRSLGDAAALIFDLEDGRIVRG